MNARAERRGRIVIAEPYAALLGRHGLDSFEAFVGPLRGEIVRDKGVRTISRMTLPGIPSPAAFYLKRHRRGSLAAALGDLLRGRRPSSPAAREWRAISALRAAGVETMQPVAYGEGSGLPWRRESFIVTAEAEGLRLEQHAPFLGGNFRERRYIIAALAECARRMHRAGLAHRDFYLSHIFAAGRGKDARIVLIDLQRVREIGPCANRWVVKDLAALNYSTPRSAASRADRLRFLRRYCGAGAGDAMARRLAGRIARKTERIRRHDEKRRRASGKPWTTPLIP